MNDNWFPDVAGKGCPAHGLTLLKLARGSNLNGITDPDLIFCGGCMEDGATPGGAWSIEVPSAFAGLDPGAAMTRLNPTPTCDFGHGEMGPDLERDQDGDPTGKLLWTCQVCCWSLPRGNIKWADQSGRKTAFNDLQPDQEPSNA